MKSGDAASLRTLLADPDAIRGDAMLTDLARIATEVGVLPTTREELLWARELCRPERREFFAAARDALARMPAARRESIEIRSLGIAVAAARMRPALLTETDEAIHVEIERRTGERRRVSPDFTGFGGTFSESLHEQRGRAVWSDLAAMAILLDLLEDSALLRHIFEQADRDREDRSTEYGGVIALDRDGRGELLEFPPRTKSGDLRFESPQALFDALYTGLFHYHNHAQKYDNGDYAGPHMGDFAFADSARANGVVFTFISVDSVDVDFYRHGRFVVDLGVVRRP